MLPFLGAAGISAGAGLLSGLFGEGDEPSQYVPRNISQDDIVKAGYKKLNTSKLKDFNNQSYADSMADVTQRTGMQTAGAGYNTNAMPGVNNWAAGKGMYGALLNANNNVDVSANEENNNLAKYIFGQNLDEQRYADRYNNDLNNSYNDDTFMNRFIAGAGAGAQLGDYINKWQMPAGSGMRKYADGGKVPMNAGVPGQDSVPAMLSPGETVINPEASAKFQPMLDMMNKHGVQTRAAGQQMEGSKLKSSYRMSEIEKIMQQDPELYMQIFKMFQAKQIQIIP